MPGIFGVIRIEHTLPHSKENLIDETLERLSISLRIDDNDKIDLFVDPSGRFGVGRIGKRHFSGQSWPFQTAAGRVYASGHPSVGGDGTTLQGFYAALIETPEAILLQASRTGSHRLHYGSWGGYLFFAPEISALLKLPGAPRDIDLAAFGVLLGSSQLYRDQTLFAGIKRLVGGTRLRVAGGRRDVEEYWLYRPGASGVRPYRPRELAHEMADLLRRSIQRHYGDPQETILFLSGGADSRALLAGALAIPSVAPSDISAVTWIDRTVPGDSDMSVARRIAEITGIRHQMMVRNQVGYGEKSEWLNERLGGGSNMAFEHPYELEMMRVLAEQGYKRSIRGDQIIIVRPPCFNLEQAWRAANFRRLRDTAAAAQLLTPAYRSDIIDASETVFADLEQRYADISFNCVKDSIWFDSRIQNYILSATYWRHMYFDERCPIHDDDVLDFMNQTPDEFRLSREGFRLAAAELWGERPTPPYADTKGLLHLTERLGAGDEVGDYVSRQFLDTDSGFWELIDRDAALGLLDNCKTTDVRKKSPLLPALRSARKMLAKLSPRLAQDANVAIKRSSVPNVVLLTNVLMLKNWHDRFITGRAPDIH